jgi:hypothetical protein
MFASAVPHGLCQSEKRCEVRTFFLLYGSLRPGIAINGIKFRLISGSMAVSNWAQNHPPAMVLTLVTKLT